MKKVGILTFHTALNYGAVLQTFALQKTLEKIGVNVEVIDYRASFNEKRFTPKPMLSLLIPRTLYGIIRHNGYEKMDHKSFENFTSKYIRLSEISYSDQSQMRDLEDIYDLIVCGSDQVWNLSCTEGDDTYFLPFIQNSLKKSSYAASFGVTNLSQEYQTQISNYLNGFSSISVREKEGVEIVNSLTNIVAEVVVDPTLLLAHKDWEKIADYSLAPISEKYLLIYLMHEDKKLLSFASEYAKKNGLKILYITQRLFKRIKAEYLRNVSPQQWIGLFLSADTIVTNSFHGSVFALNFNKNVFIKYIPRSIANSRLKNIIEEYNIQSHLLTIKNISTINFIPIDSNFINIKLNSNRLTSLNYLKKLCEG